MKMHELLTDESKWIKQKLAIDNNDECVTPSSPYATKWCLVGAITKCYSGPKHREVYDKILNAIPKNEHESIAHWNDCVATFEDIRSVLLKLDI